MVEVCVFMTRNLSREFSSFHYVAGNRIGSRGASSSDAQEMTMLMLSLVRTLAVLAPLAVKLATWLVARSLNMPEPLVQATGLFVFVRVQAFENSVAQSLCPVRFARRLLAWFR
jgi:hypothetical protein